MDVTWNTMLEISQNQTENIVWSSLYEVPKTGKSTETKKLPKIREKRSGELLFNEYRVSSGMMKKYWKMDSDDGCTTLWIMP